ncbi:hypothetical protein GGI07_002848 [Coemansia sp. Benny D115]|nr:hypothetical protein GGI07_002848 [Coemansia sp. Benny D115]
MLSLEDLRGIVSGKAPDILVRQVRIPDPPRPFDFGLEYGAVAYAVAKGYYPADILDPEVAKRYQDFMNSEDRDDFLSKPIETFEAWLRVPIDCLPIPPKDLVLKLNDAWSYYVSAWNILGGYGIEGLEYDYSHLELAYRNDDEEEIFPQRPWHHIARSGKQMFEEAEWIKE